MNTPTERVLGIGGLFFRSPDPKQLAQWHEFNLGIYHRVWQQAAGPTAFTPFAMDRDYFGSKQQGWMVNFRVGFSPVPTWWQMLPYWTMQDYYRWARHHPELNMPSQSDIDQARIFAGLPPETGNASFEEFTAPVPNSTPPKP